MLPWAVPKTSAVKVEVKGLLPEDGETDNETPRVLTVNVAVTFLAALMVTAQAPVPEQSPDQPLKI